MFEWMGLNRWDWSVAALIITTTLAPYFGHFAVHGWSELTSVSAEANAWLLLRNYLFVSITFNIDDNYCIIQSPAAEEFIYRGCCIVPLLIDGTVSNWLIIAVTPLMFGAAHLHHAWHQISILSRQLSPNTASERENMRQMKRQVKLNTLVQFAYTTAFGWYASHLFLRTRSLWYPTIAHIICNTLGLPDFDAIVVDGRTSVKLVTVLGIATFVYANLYII